MHPEDIKAEIRKAHGSVFAFEDASDLPRKSVSDFLRGRANKRVAAAIAKLISPGQADLSDDSRELVGSHGQNAATSRADSHRLSETAE